VAIVTKKGLLQVKSVRDGVTDKDSLDRIKTVMFPDEAAWLASLPPGKAVIDLVDPDKRSQVQKLLDKPLQCQFSNPSDGDRLNEFMERFKIQSDVITRSSADEMVKSALRTVEYLRAELNKITIEEELAGKKRHQLNLNLNRALRKYSHYKCMTYRTENPSVGTTYLYTRHANRLRTNIGDIEYELGVKDDRLNATQIAIRRVSSKNSPAILYNTLAEMGNPKIYMIYRRRRHEIPL
jgi:hypothetical protein